VIPVNGCRPSRRVAATRSSLFTCSGGGNYVGREVP
jgi:hypothetical protein